MWKVEVKEGEKLETDKVVTILEAMKLEIAVRAEEEVQGSTVEKLLVKPNDVVSAGQSLMLVRKAKK